MNFFNFFDWDQKYKCMRHNFQYLAQFIAPMGGSGAIQSSVIGFCSKSVVIFFSSTCGILIVYLAAAA